MKKLIYITLIAITLISCADGSTVTAWVKKAKKPIICREIGQNALGQSKWTLIDADGNIFITPLMTISLPDTIKALK